MSSGRKMRGFMCQSPASTAVCVPGDVRSVIVPRRFVDHHHGVMKGAKYSRLVESSTRPTHASTGSAVFLPTVGKGRDLQQPRQPDQLPSSSDVFQVVVLRVSIHCQACAGKVKKHLSKMEGVTSFSIDLETKRVTVMGRLSPTGVLESISKIKKAELWR